MMAKVPNLVECQPRFVAYCKAHGLREGDEWQTWEYMAWISKKQRNFASYTGCGAGILFTSSAPTDISNLRDS